MKAFRCLALCALGSTLFACTSSEDSIGDEKSELRRRHSAASDPNAALAAMPAQYTLVVTAPQANASVSGAIDVTGAAPGFVNLEVHSSSGELLARVSPDGSGNFIAPIDTTRLGDGAQTLAVDAWDSAAGTMYTNHASASVTVDVANGGAVDPTPVPPVSTPPVATNSCIDANGNGIRYFGAYTKNTQTNYDFDNWAGFKQDFLTSFINCDTWANAAASDWGFDIMSSQPPGENIQQVACLTTSEDPSFQHVAAGMYDAQIAAIGQLFLKHNYPNAIIRVGHEFEGNWYPWGTWGGVNNGDVSGFIGAFRRASSILKQVSPGFTIVWNPGCSWMAAGADSRQFYPGDDVVDVIGVDCYDDNSGVDHLINGPYGMNEWASFAKAHGKPIALPEWGLMTGGDNPAFIDAMYQFMISNNTFLESYWDSDDGNTLSQITTGEAPQSGAMFLSTFSQYARGCKQ